MNKSPLTPEEARDARSYVSLSQAKVARATGLSRTKIALFEVGKYILDDEGREALRSFYAAQGYEFGSDAPKRGTRDVNVPEAATTAAIESSVRLVDGFAIPPAAEADAVEEALAEVAENEQKIEELATHVARVGWFSEEPDMAYRDEIVRLMARSYWLIRRTQGAELLTRAGESSPDSAPTHGTLAAALLGG